MNETIKFERKQCQVCYGYGEKEYQKIDIDGGIFETGVRGCGRCDMEGYLYFTNDGKFYTLKQIMVDIIERNQLNKATKLHDVKEWHRADFAEYLLNVASSIVIDHRNKVTITMELT
jgi:hypothetical protein